MCVPENGVSRELYHLSIALVFVFTALSCCKGDLQYSFIREGEVFACKVLVQVSS